MAQTAGMDSKELFESTGGKGEIMRSAQIENNIVVNFAEVNGFDHQFIDPLDSVIGSVWDGVGFLHPAPLAPVVPESVSPRQIRQALTAANLRTAVEAAVAAGTQDLKDWWEFATQFERAHPMVAGMALQLGVTSEQLDQLWIAGGAL